jgi:hypothetical protein
VQILNDPQDFWLPSRQGLFLKPYKPVAMPGEKDVSILRTPRLKSLGHALDFRETFREIWHGAVYLRDKAQGKLPQSDMGAR